jgi:hypothetical protein
LLDKGKAAVVMEKPCFHLQICNGFFQKKLEKNNEIHWEFSDPPSPQKVKYYMDVP